MSLEGFKGMGSCALSSISGKCVNTQKLLLNGRGNRYVRHSTNKYCRTSEKYHKRHYSPLFRALSMDAIQIRHEDMTTHAPTVSQFTQYEHTSKIPKMMWYYRHCF